MNGKIENFFKSKDKPEKPDKVEKSIKQNQNSLTITLYYSDFHSSAHTTALIVISSNIHDMVVGTRKTHPLTKSTLTGP